VTECHGSHAVLALEQQTLVHVVAITGQQHLGRAEEYLGFEPLKKLPSHYVREHVYFSVQYERVAIKERQHVGADRIMFATDFPHIENGWPNSRPMIDNILEGDKRKIWAGNAVEFFKLKN
jgi:predicted TIM-barrel fold metal-dependent hydrolase